MSEALSLLTWNVNSIRARLDHALEVLDEWEPDVACFQESKVEDRLFPRVPFMELGYEVHIHGTKGRAGVATLTKGTASEVQCGFAQGDADAHPRILALSFRGTRVYNLYCPNGTAFDSPNFPYKLEWFRRLRAELDRDRSPQEPLILCGDFNVAPDARDVYDPEAMQGRLHFSEEEHRVLAELCDFGLEDCFRRFEAEGGHFTWFDYRQAAWERRHGLRIDHVYATQTLAARCEWVRHELGPRGWEAASDHVPVRALFAAES